MFHNLHVGEGPVVLKIPSEVRLDESLGFCERLVPTAAKQGNAGEAEQCGDEGAIWDPTQTAHTAVIATCLVR